ncbi:MAG: hypothetical protein H6751_08785 [Candidatus Omnitrophica bacterium]|nr:hypothetical protein [Candidatus Omnitrophota bacterium]
MRRICFFIFLAALNLGIGGVSPGECSDNHFIFPESGLKVEDRVLLLAVDDHLLRDRENLALTLHSPEVRAEPVLTPERNDPNAPDSMASHFYGTVLYDRGKYRMWYYAVSLRAEPDDLKQGPVCYAESFDGLEWVKPSLGQVEINGSTDNNAIALPDEVTQCAAVILDEEDPDPSRRYKMLYTTLTHTWVFRPATSPDGIHWTAAKGYPTDRFLEMGSFFKFGDRYIVHGQGVGQDDNGVPEGRQGYASVSPDFMNWDRTYRPSFRLPEPDDVEKRGLVGDYPQVHLGVGATSFGNVAVGLYGIWHNPSEAERRKKGWYGAGLIYCDLGLVVSNDGITFREPVAGNVFISSQESPVTQGPKENDPTILCQANGILDVGDQTLIYHGRWRNATNTSEDYYAEVALATLPRDRWGDLHLEKGATAGVVWSAPITLPESGCEISLNADRARDVSVELTDEKGDLLVDFSGENRGLAAGSDGLIQPVEWKENSLSALGGQTIRIKISISNPEARLYAVYLDAE